MLSGVDRRFVFVVALLASVVGCARSRHEPTALVTLRPPEEPDAIFTVEMISLPHPVSMIDTKITVVGPDDRDLLVSCVPHDAGGDGRLSERDTITCRYVGDRPLVPGTQYDVTFAFGEQYDADVSVDYQIWVVPQK